MKKDNLSVSLNDYRGTDLEKSFVENDLEKAVYKDNEENRRLGRVGKEYGRRSAERSAVSKVGDRSKTQDKLVEGDLVSYQRTKGAGLKIPFKGEIVSIDRDGKYAQVRNSIGDIDYVPVSDLKKRDRKLSDAKKSKDIPTRKDKFDVRVGDTIGNTVSGFNFELLEISSGTHPLKVKDKRSGKVFNTTRENMYLSDFKKKE